MATGPPGIGPGKFEKAVTLRDGSTLRLRPIRRDDEDRLLDLFHRLSPYTVYLRFHHVITELPQSEARRFCEIDYDDTFALVATTGEGTGEEIVGDARYYRLPTQDSAEVAVVVDDAYQGRGVGGNLLLQLAIIAQQNGINYLEAEVLAENQEVMSVLKYAGPQTIEHLEGHVFRVVVNIAPDLAVRQGWSQQGGTP